MGLLVRVNRDHRRHRWTVVTQDGRRVGHAIGLLLEDVTFETQGPSGWALGSLYSWADIQLDAKFAERLEARTVSYLEMEGTMFHPLTFRNGYFYVYGGPIQSAGWLRMLGRDAFVAGSRPPTL